MASLVLAAVLISCEASLGVERKLSPSPADHVAVVGSWTGDELTAFRSVLAEFTARTGATVDYIETRDLHGVIDQRLQQGQPLDVAGLNGPQHLTELARQHSLRPLDEAIDIAAYKADVAPTFVELGSVDERLYGAFIKSSLKGLIWYNPHVFRRGIPSTWDELERLGAAAATGPTRQWCVGLGSAESSGWPGTDWIENILIRQSGPAVYDRWVNGQQPWSSAEITRAFQTFGQIVADDAVFGGASGAISTDFKKAGDPLFADPPGCLLMAQGSFMIPFLSGSTRTVGADFDFFPTPQLNPAFDGAVVGGGDLVGLFSQKPAAQKLIAFLVSAEGQARWVASGGALSINSRVLTYPTDVAKRAASMLVSARQFRFDGSDQMPTAMNDAFLKAVLDFTGDQRRLPDLLAELDAVRESAYGR